MNIEGRIVLEGVEHEVEYEPGQMLGLSTLYLRVREGSHCVPIHTTKIDEVIDMLRRGKAAIKAVEKK